ncbi:PAS domain S-box protein [Paenibacillus oenotherae]|uniref:histidine kinase n=1 Tax=Paenibacillus oenotherae TaxID=1435645 RepID=A0ABS7D8M5_9BACL|nr:PAS domain S-box protein [Paenibacillus oenotherae]MBW7476113.1 PAS domain S-box protein [Paenibacillus oenotherae]
MLSLHINHESLVNQLMAYSSHAMAIVTPEGEWVAANRSLCRMLGYTYEELTALQLEDIVHSEDRWADGKRHDIVEAALEYESLVSEHGLMRKNGSTVWVSLNTMRIIDEGTGSPVLVVLHFTEIQERLELEGRLSRTEKLYQIVVDNTRDLIYQTSEAGVILSASPSLHDLLDYSPEEVVGKEEAMLYHPEDLQPLADCKLQGSARSQFRMRHRDGYDIWFESMVKQLKDSSGSTVIVVIGREITDRKKQEDFIREAQRIALIGSWEWDIDKGEIALSDQLYLIYNLEGNHAKGRLSQLTDLVPSRDRQRFKESIEGALEGENLSFEFRTSTRDGKDQYLHIRGVVVLSDTGIPERMNGTIQDITERKEIERKLQETIERYTSLKKYNHDAIVSLDLEGNIINANKMTEELTGYRLEELIGHSFSSIIGNQDIKSILTHSLEDMSAEQSIDRIYHKDGHVAEVLATIVPIIINSENVGYYIIAKDITEQKRLIIDKEAAESTNKAKSEFLAMMSHEIRTPMNGVIGMTDLLMETTILDTEQRGYLEIIRKSGDTLLTIINDILDFSKIDSGNTELLEEPFDIRGCIFEAVDILSPKAQEKRLEVSFSMSPDLPPVLVGDYQRLKQVLMNLIGNGIKFTNSGSVAISVNKEAHVGNEVKLRFTIKDTGIGIDKEKVQYLFQPFYQLDNFMTRTLEGTGLGLAISKRLVNLMNGEIWLEPTDGPGSTFIFTVILKEIERRNTGIAEHAPLNGQAIQRALRILIAEDNKINQMVLVKMLEKQGHAVRVVENGVDVINLAYTGEYDVIFMDVHMPGMNGLEATAVIKDKLGDNCPIIIAVTANALKGDRELCFAAGMDDYISKPISTRVVFDILRKFFDI